MHCMRMSKTRMFPGKPEKVYPFLSAMVVGKTGLEPVTPRLSSACSNQLSYMPWLVGAGVFCRVEATGFEPVTFCVQNRRSTN